MIDKKILFFTDLEGTILRDSDGKFDELDFYDLVTELEELGKLTHSSTEMRLVSPIGFKRMDRVVDQMDTVIMRYFKGKNSNVRLVEAAASPFDMKDDFLASHRHLSKKIIPLPKVSFSSDIARDAKRKYLKYVLDSYKDDKSVLLTIYAGNDRNDLDAMGIIKRRKDGFTLCPENSIEQVKAISDFVSDKSDIEGIIEGLSKINENIRKRNVSKDKEIEFN